MRYPEIRKKISEVKKSQNRIVPLEQLKRQRITIAKKKSFNSITWDDKHFFSDEDF